MPTARPRHMITETDEVAAALDAAAARWPEDADSRAQLAIRLLLEGERAIEADEQKRVRARREAMDRTAGRFTGMFEPGYRERLRSEWPE
ncbi:hypothetical protein [Knoellia koreensis]|uniref:Uncharacterized protein n=1 Tax=Knoellia koreensis TaxID=2730921 RepID=A0A849HDJ3_9MICO|nr:hypothetical protein [Knoellia sp. DB2414S]NNM44713.1 hypothetical protein [Knoellia sp. DB2414S]